MDSHIFIFNGLKVFFKHTDYYGFVHPYNYYEWTSYVREDFFQQKVPTFKDVVSRPIKMMTVKIMSEVFADSEFGDGIEARLTVGKVKKVSFDMIIRFVNMDKNKLVCLTNHTIVFIDSETGKFADIPDEMKRVIVNYLEKGSDVKS